MLLSAKRIPANSRSANKLQIRRGYVAAAVSRVFRDAAGIFPSNQGGGTRALPLCPPPFSVFSVLNLLTLSRNQQLRIQQLLLRENKMNPHSANDQNQKRKHAALRPHRPARQPGRPMKSRVKQMPLRQKSAVRHPIKICLRPIPSRVHSNRKPDVPSPLQTKSRQNAERPRHRRAEPRFAQIAQVDRSKKNRKKDRRRPEPDPRPQRRLHVSAETTLLKQPHHQERNPVQCSKFQRVRARKRHAA